MTPRPESIQPIPNNAQLVFKGKVFDVYQWEQEMYDGTKQTFEKLKRPDTVVVFAVMDDGKIMLTEQEQPGKAPFIGAAGGRMDEGEDVLTAAKRELLEETGYEASEFILWKAQHPTSKIDWVVYFFIAKGLKKVSDQNLDAGEKIKLKFVDFEELPKIVASDNFSEKEIIVDFLNAELDPNKKEELKKLFSI
jgi:ADP-ribose pyrophosphatase